VSSSRYPSAPFRVDDTTPICDRIALTNGLASEGEDDPELQALARVVFARAGALAAVLAGAAPRDPLLGSVVRAQQWFARLLALEALRAVQSLPYVPCPVGVDCYQPVAYTLAHGGECKALVATLLALERVLGLRADPYWITQKGQDINHMTSFVWLDGQELWSDPSIRGAMLGESPYQATRRLGPNAALGQVTAPAGRAAAPTDWRAAWRGWPAWWFSQYHPGLTAPYATLVANPTAYGFYDFDRLSSADGAGSHG